MEKVWIFLCSRKKMKFREKGELLSLSGTAPRLNGREMVQISHKLPFNNKSFLGEVLNCN